MDYFTGLIFIWDKMIPQSGCAKFSQTGTKLGDFPLENGATALAICQIR